MFEWITDLFNTLISFLYSLLLSAITMFEDLIFGIYESMLAVGEGLIATINLMLSPIDISQYMTGFPSGVSWVLAQVGAPQAMGIIIVAITVRLFLQLIPFVRLGS